ncbi:MAG: hypothetical protein NC191_06955 [Muribaculaceae bacterium]|nr:hypothetical protein [Muribaculaceae bacterium]
MDKVKTGMWVLGILLAIAFWFFTIDGIPKRVEKLETDIEIIKTQVNKNDTKIDIMLEDIKFIKQLEMQKHG